MRLLPLALGVLWPAIAIAGPSEEELAFPPMGSRANDEQELVAEIVHTPRFPQTEHAVRLLLDLLRDEDRVYEQRQWVERLADDPVITFRRTELATSLRELQLQFARDDADDIEREARRTNAPADFERCAAGYDVLVARLEHASELRPYWRDIQLDLARYNSAVCTEHAGHPVRALMRYGAAASTATGSLGRYAQLRFVRLLGALPQIGAARALGLPLTTVERPRKIFEYDFPDDAID